MQGISALGGVAATGLDAMGLYTGGGLGTTEDEETSGSTEGGETSDGN